MGHLLKIFFDLILSVAAIAPKYDRERIAGTIIRLLPMWPLSNLALLHWLPLRYCRYLSNVPATLEPHLWGLRSKR